MPFVARMLAILSIGILLGAGFYLWQFFANNSRSLPDISPPAGSEPKSSDTYQEQTSRPPAIIPVEKIIRVLPRDAIPSIDKPRFLKASEQNFLFEQDVVLGVYYKGVARAYPHKILVWHEIVNDVIAGLPVAVTYCPLCQTDLVFVRILEGRPVEFGVSGMLYNSDLVMYDRFSNTLWSQVWGKGLVGRFAGHQLERIPVDLIRWGDWVKLYPESEVLSMDTGFQRSYGYDPYRGYYTSPEIWFPIEHEDKRLGPKEPIWGIVVNGAVKAYQERLLQEKVVLNDEVSNLKVVVYMPFLRGARFFEREIDGRTLTFRNTEGRLVDTETGSLWNFDGVAVEGPMKGSQLRRVAATPSFWFAWATFYPGTELEAPSVASTTGATTGLRRMEG